jgi:hypothetical protein
VYRRCFYANGLFWVFFFDGTNLVYATSSNGSSWSVASIARSGIDDGRSFDIYFDGTYVHYVYDNFTNGGAGNAITTYYRRGTPASNGSISWSQSEQTVISNTALNWAMLAVDSNGYPWIAYATTGNSETGYPYVIKSSTNDGTWSTASGFPYQLDTTLNGYWEARPVPLPNGNMVVIFTAGSEGNIHNGYLCAAYWNGSSWGTEVFGTEVVTYQFFSIVPNGNNPYIAYITGTSSPYTMRVVQYSYSSNSFGTPVTLESGVTTTNTDNPLSIDASGNLFCFWDNYPSSNYLYYIRCIGGTWDSNPTTWQNESAATIPSPEGYELSCFNTAYGGFIGLVYMTGSSSPYNIKFIALAPVTAVQHWFM